MGAEGLTQVLKRIEEAETWDDRVEEIRRIPDQFGVAQHQKAYAAVAETVYAPHLAANFAHVLWTKKYELPYFEAAYREADRLTVGFTKVAPENLAAVLQQAPSALLAFRTIIGYRQIELAVAATEVARDIGANGISQGRINAIEGGTAPSDDDARTCGETLHRLISGHMWDAPTKGLRTKLEKPDTSEGWASVQRFAKERVQVCPTPVSSIRDTTGAHFGPSWTPPVRHVERPCLRNRCRLS